MRTSISASKQVQEWLRSLAPEPRNRVRHALRELAERDAGDIKTLEAELTGFYRLRVGGYRIIFSYAGGGVLRLEYAELCEMVYERFTELLKGSGTSEL